MKNFNNLDVSRFWNSEIKDFTNKMVELVLNAGPEQLNLQFVSQQLVSAQSQINAIHIPYGSDIKTADIQSNAKKLLSLIRIIIGQVNVVTSSAKLYEIPQLEMISEFVKRYLTPLVKANFSKRNDTLTEMFASIEADQTLSQALTDMNLMTYFNDLKATQQVLNQDLLLRNESLAARPKADTKNARTAGRIAIKQLMNEIELMKLKHTDLDYQTLIDQINQLILFYSSTVKARNTRRSKSEEQNSTDTTTTVLNANSDTVAA